MAPEDLSDSALQASKTSNKVISVMAKKSEGKAAIPSRKPPRPQADLKQMEELTRMKRKLSRNVRIP
jgi:hypothetical protein